MAEIKVRKWKDEDYDLLQSMLQSGSLIEEHNALVKAHVGLKQLVRDYLESPSEIAREMLFEAVTNGD